MKGVLQVLSFDVLSKAILGTLGVVLIRFMPASEYAEYTFALGLTAFAAQGIAATFNRMYVLAAGTGHELGEWPIIVLQAGALVFLILLARPLLSGLGSTYWLIAGLVLASCGSEFAKTYYQRRLSFLRFSFVELFRSVTFFVAAVGLIAISGAQLSSGSVLGVQAASLLLVTLVALAWKARAWSAPSVASIRLATLHVAQGKYANLFAYFLLLAFFTQTDIFMLKAVGDDAMLATYGSAFRYYSILSLALGAVHAVLLPSIQRQSDPAALRLLLQSHRKMLALFTAIALAAAWLAGWVIPWVDGGKYPDAVATFRILCVSAVISFAFSPYVHILISQSQFRFLSLSILAALAGEIALCWVLIPLQGALGAAIAMALSAALANGGFFLRSRAVLAARGEA